MSKKHIRIVKTKNLNLSRGSDGYWLYDEARGMNIAMRSNSERDACLDALRYYQFKVDALEKERKELKTALNKITELASPHSEDWT